MLFLVPMFYFILLVVCATTFLGLLFDLDLLCLCSLVMDFSIVSSLYLTPTIVCILIPLYYEIMKVTLLSN